ncbi:hypothetical protein C479_14518 [Halovivax asiaticus JCM 14624]|uniref:Uncharacterized protein n=1 Tax=Halovivax asiaticus JCM 14624 TaxID=1227490 RepID=M0BCD3_9EURY|nr:hypothetical protein [Halovivax asiaticus]ELZ08561.1 hypothetical protein C479_14518 [Halovivax asiaticus JCM 14624]
MSNEPDRRPDDHARIGPYRVEPLADPERGLRVGCERHDEWTEFDPSRRSVAFYCPDCSMEIEVTLHDDLDWRDWGERC